MTKKEAEKRARRSVSFVHILVAVVAIIECLLLMSFTTFSWIESNSSLVIQNGPESSQENTNITKKMNIAGSLNSILDLNYDGDAFAKLNTFFSEVKYFEFAKATSSDGKTLFFPCRNNTYSTAGKYRKADTIDYNTSFLYFDFILSNQGTLNENVENRDIYFANDDLAGGEGFEDIFTVTGGDFTDAQRTAICNAMRMSVTTQVNNATPNTTIYAKKSHAAESGSGNYKSFDAIPANQSYAYDENGGASHTNNRNTWVATKDIDNSVYHTTNSVVDSDKLFVAKKNAKTKVSIRIWFDVFDPDFRSVFGLDDAAFDYDPENTNYADYYKISSVNVGIKFKLISSGNDLRSIYFDDYTFTNQTGININHLTDENPAYSVWFYAYQPYVAASSDHPERQAGYVAIPLERESSDVSHSRWTSNTATASMMEYLKNEGTYTNASGVTNASLRYQKSYFCYGDYNTKKAIYKWELPAAPTDDDFVFNAYSYQPNSSYTPAAAANGWSDCVKVDASTPIKLGVGIWQDTSANTTMTLLKFRDMATVVTDTSYNGGNNFQIMNAAAELDAHTNYLVYANNLNAAQAANNFNAAITAAMYYDETEQVFKSYVPTYWLAGGSAGNSGVSFTYTPSGSFNYNDATIRWYNNTPQPLNGDYIFTALGYSNRNSNATLGGIGYTAGVFSGSQAYLCGVGTWRDVEEIRFSTELIDSYLNTSYRYFIGITDSYSQGYYVMIPDESNMTFSAYIPAEQGSTAAGVKFARLDSVKTTNSNITNGPSVYWYGNLRHNSYGDDYDTFYPVDCALTTATENYTHGYWNLSVLVDGTYENLISDTLTDGAHDTNNNPVATYAPIVTTGSTTVVGSIDYSPRDNYGTLEYSYNGSTWQPAIVDDTTDTITNCIDRYRFYAPAENQATVYWRWTPYAAYSCTIYVDHDDDSSTANVETTYAAPATEFIYTHNVADAAETGIYQVVTEARYVPAA